MSSLGDAHLDALVLTAMLADGEMAAVRELVGQSSPLMLSLGFTSVLGVVIPRLAHHEGVHPRDVLDKLVADRIAVDLATDLT